MKSSGAMGSNSPHLSPSSKSSAKTNVPVGSGSRPGASRIKIPSSAPENPETLGRKTPGALS